MVTNSFETSEIPVGPNINGTFGGQRHGMLENNDQSLSGESQQFTNTDTAKGEKKRVYGHEETPTNKRVAVQSPNLSTAGDSPIRMESLSPSLGRSSENSQFGFVDIKKLEHSARILQKNIKIILDEAPDLSELLDLINTRANDMDALTYDSLKNNKLVHLASQLKTLYKAGKLDIFDQIMENKVEGPGVEDGIESSQIQKDLDMSRISINNSSKEPTPILSESSGIPSESEYTGTHTPDTGKTQGVETHEEPFFHDGNGSNVPQLPPIKDPHLLARVFIHKSTINNKSYLYQSELIASHNERLEFLGDSVLNNVATIILYNRYPTAPEGELSKMRSILVNNVTLAEFSINYGFDKKLKSNINDAILRQGKQKIFADIFEAYVGALAMENHLEFGVIKDWLYKLFYSRLKGFDAEIKGTEEVNKDAKSELYSLVGTAAFHPTYKVVKTGDGASKPFKVDCVMGEEILGTGVAPGLKEAGLRAAMMALKNKPLLEKYIQLRLHTDKAQSLATQKSVGASPILSGSGSPNNSSNTSAIPSIDSLGDSSLNVTLPLRPTEDLEFDSDARNKLYAIVSRTLNLVPEYVCKETKYQWFEAELTVNNVVLATASDISKKKAMAKAAKLVLDNLAVLNAVKTKN